MKENIRRVSNTRWAIHFPCILQGDKWLRRILLNTPSMAVSLNYWFFILKSDTMHGRGEK